MELANILIKPYSKHMNNSRCIITSASDKYFPSLLNMLGSFKANYPDHPQIYIYDLGLSAPFKKEILKIAHVTILDIPHFVPFWRSCYTWKTYILNTPLAESNFYIDAGCQILQPLDAVFEKIEQNGYLLVSQGPEVLTYEIVPKDYSEIFDIEDRNLNSEIIAAGLFGFKKDSSIGIVTQKLYNAGQAGLCLGFSQGELWKNKGKNRNIFIRNCLRFRHDTTLLTIFVLKYMKQAVVESIENFDGNKSGRPEQLLWNLRMNYTALEYLNILNLNIFTKIYLNLFLKAKMINLWIKRQL